MEVRFYLHPKPDKSGENQILISLSSNGARFLTTTGYKIIADKWDKAQQKVKRGATSASGIPYNIINAALDKTRVHFGSMDDVARKFTKEELAEEYRSYRGLTPKPAKNGDGESAQGGNGTVKSALLKFTTEQGRLNGWSDSTFKKFKTLENHLSAYKSDMAIGDIDDDALSGFVAYLIKKGFNNNYIKKLAKILAWFLRWAQKKGYCGDMDLDCLSPRLKTPERHVIYLDWNELMTVYNFNVPAAKNYIARVRDIFCFCCFTGLRFSDAQNLKRADVYEDKISISTIKTSERLEIPLGKHARAILDRYAGENFPNGKALPSISNQKANQYLKELCFTCGINRPITVVDFRGSQRIEAVKPKWELIGTHCGRRTFISNALALGVPVTTVMSITGHSDFQAMKPYIEIAERAKQEAIELLDAQ